VFHLVLWHALLGWQEGQLTCKKCCLSETGEGKTDGELANSIDTKTHAACPKHIIIIIIIKGIYIAQVRKGHKCAMSAEMAVWLRNCNIHSWVSRTRKVKPIWILLKQETVSGSGISWTICPKQVKVKPS